MPEALGSLSPSPPPHPTSCRLGRLQQADAVGFFYSKTPKRKLGEPHSLLPKPHASLPDTHNHVPYTKWEINEKQPASLMVFLSCASQAVGDVAQPPQFLVEMGSWPCPLGSLLEAPGLVSPPVSC